MDPMYFVQLLNAAKASAPPLGHLVWEMPSEEHVRRLRDAGLVEADLVRATREHCADRKVGNRYGLGNYDLDRLAAAVMRAVRKDTRTIRVEMKCCNRVDCPEGEIVGLMLRRLVDVATSSEPQLEWVLPSPTFAEIPYFGTPQ